MNVKRKKAICFHGFLGSRHDFKTLGSSFDVVALDLSPQISEFGIESWASMCQRIASDVKKILQALDPKDQVYFFSYSMGSKVLFSIFSDVLKIFSAARFDSKPIFVMISTHFGLYEDSTELQKELTQRTKMNQDFLKILSLEDMDLFLEKWSELSLFSKDRLLTTTWGLKQVTHYFESWNQSQTSELANILDSGYSFLVVTGSADTKYRKQSERLQRLKRPHLKFLMIQDRSHRLLQEQDLHHIMRALDHDS